MNRTVWIIAMWLCGCFSVYVVAAEKPMIEPLFRTVDLDQGETAEVTLSNGKTVTLKLLEVHETRGRLHGAVRRAVGYLDVIVK